MTRATVTRRLGVALAATLASASIVPALADASSIVFIKNGNVWLSAPDGSRQRAVTTDGGWSSPSQADNGTILALRGERFVRMGPTGERIGAPVASIVPDDHGDAGGLPQWSGPFDPVISPDGTKIAYWWSYRYFHCDTSVCDYQLRFQSTTSYADRFTDPTELGEVRDYTAPSWLDDQHQLLSATAGGVESFGLHTLGGGDDAQHFQQWFSTRASDGSYLSLDYGTMSRAHDKLAAISDQQSGGPIEIYSWGGTPPYPGQQVGPEYPQSRCTISRPTGTFESPTWSPDGTSLAYSDGDGVSVVDERDLTPTSAACSHAPTLIIPGGRDPYWGPTDVPAGSQPTSPPAGGSGPTPPATTPPGGRSKAPAITGLRLWPNGRLRLRLSVPATLTVSVIRCARRTCTQIFTAKRVAPAGTITLHAHRLRAGRYKATATATDAAGHHSHAEHAQLHVTA